MKDSDIPPAACAPEKEGWETRSFGQEPRISEMADLYRELGFEVLIEPFTGAECDGCTICFEGEVKPILVVYTRKGINQ
ncbi:MAG: hypothetical protein P9X24_17855 [Candidatus Hatepunaea meridiana]|nr:hypothetical protein [Candidatus Hatepunaea meridiana]